MPVSGQYPVNLVLTGRRVLVVGGGPVARRKVDGLVEAGADSVLVVAPEVVDGIEAAPGVRVERRPYRSREAGDFDLVLCAVDDEAVAQQVFDDAVAAGVWVNSADDPDRCTFTVPARVRRGSLLLTASTGGRSPAVSAWVRSRLEAEYGPEYDDLVDVAGEVRESILAAGGSTEGLDWQSALDSGMLEQVRTDRAAAKYHLIQCLSSSSE